MDIFKTVQEREAANAAEQEAVVHEPPEVLATKQAYRTVSRQELAQRVRNAAHAAVERLNGLSMPWPDGFTAKVGWYDAAEVVLTALTWPGDQELFLGSNACLYRLTENGKYVPVELWKEEWVFHSIVLIGALNRIAC